MREHPSESRSNERLQEAARQGDKVAAAELLSRSRQHLTGFCYRYFGNVHEAEDAAHDVLARMCDVAAWPSDFRAFLYRAARNHCLNLRKRRRDGRLGVGSFLGDTRFPSPRTGPPTAAVRSEDHAQLRAHLASLTRAHAEVLILRYFEGLSRKEMAEVLELPESVVKSRLHEALKALQKKIRREA